MTSSTSSPSRHIRQLPASQPLHEEQHEHVVNILNTIPKIARNNTQHFQSNVRSNDDGVDAHENRSNGYTRFVDEIYSSIISAYDHLRRRREPPKECHHLAYGLIIMDELDIDDASDVEE